ncbi:hydrolase Nlp/P60 [Prosthecochloris sp. GSB1]|uniref:C40 family peptidase n=1 Tax=Prosthecochloris sp. GSB1 TaxID=281093 RepID=UPI000B8CC323|nr:NlpC/P60 family protein [Prosthecochloris sp. GSB1]ASQ89689.1 hydrolase Nlp/P60 [Prosthecochloris sp. GSB1]
MTLRSLIRRPGFASCNAPRALRSLFLLLCFSSLLSVAVPSVSFASITSCRSEKKQEEKRPAYSMSRFFDDVRQFFGVRYRWGGQTPEGFDCSGFVKFMYERVFNLALPRTSIEMASIGRPVDRSDLMPGDLVFFHTRGTRINHVGIFVGNGAFIHSSLSRGVTWDRLQERYFDTRFAGAVRVIDGIVPDMPDFAAPSGETTDSSQPS